MQIPHHYIGRWRGFINDNQRTEAYEGELVISSTQVSVTYLMKKGTKAGELPLRYASDDFIILRDEVVSSWRGEVVLYRDNDDTLRCVWRSGWKFCDALMTRIEQIKSP